VFNIVHRKTAAPSFKLSELFPCLTFHPEQDVKLLFPSNFNISQMGIATKHMFQEQILQCRTWYQGMRFFLGPGNEAFVDSWAIFFLASAPETPFSLMVQSRQTIVNRVSSDCGAQLSMCEEAVQPPLQFPLLVISDGIHKFSFLYYHFDSSLRSY
jgi:hypothetical protein